MEAFSALQLVRQISQVTNRRQLGCAYRMISQLVANIATLNCGADLDQGRPCPASKRLRGIDGMGMSMSAHEVKPAEVVAFPSPLAKKPSTPRSRRGRLR